MFRKIGLKIKRLAVVFTVLGILASIGGSIAFVAMNSYIFRYDSNDKILVILAAVGILVGGIIVSWLSSFMLYGFGELVDQTQKTRELIQDMHDRQMIGNGVAYAVPSNVQPQPVQRVPQYAPPVNPVQNNPAPSAPIRQNPEPFNPMEQ